MIIKRSLFLSLLLVQLLLAKTVVSQSTAPTARTPGAPAGSYKLSDFESVNLFSGNLNVSLPLLSVNGRGQTGQMLTLTIETQWHVERFETGIPDNWGHYITPRTPFPVGFIGQITSETLVDQTGETTCGGGNWVNHRFNFTFVDMDGTEHMLVDPVYHGRPYKTCATISTNYGRVFESTNNEFMTFVSDADVWSFGSATGYLHYKDGGKSRIVNSRIMWTQDRNGNRTVYEYDANDPAFYPPLAKKITDSIGRQIVIAYDVNEGSPYGICDKITYKGYQGADRIIRVSKGNLHNFLRTTQIYDSSTIKTKVELFPDNPNDSVYISDPNEPQDPLVVGAVWLADGRSYQFKYNVYGRIARVVLPTGGAIEYDYEPTVLNGPGAPDAYITNRINEKRVYKDGTTLEGKTTFTGTQTSQGFPPGSSGWVMDVQQFDHLGNRLTKAKHFFKGFANGTWGFVVPWWNGREIKTEFFAANGTTVLQRIENDWRQRIPSWCYNNLVVPGACGGDPPNTAPTINPFMVETKTTLVDANLVTKTSFVKPDGSFGFDSFNNQTDLYEYDFASGAPGPLKRHTQWAYMSSTTYTGNGVHLLSLPTRISVYDAAEIERARTTYEYDVYSGANHAALKDWSTITGLGMFGHDAAFNSSNLIRGNPTATIQHLLTNGVVTGSITNFTQYDLAGNAVKVIDARGNVTTIDYLDCFGTPNGEARTNGTSGLSGTGLNSYAFPTIITNALNHKTYSQFDYYLGQTVDAEDANATLTSFVFDDPLDRPTQIRRAVGTTKENQTTHSYDDTNRIMTTFTDKDSNNDNAIVVKKLYDPIGRTVETRQYETISNYTAIQTQYDALGRPFKVSNPFRPWKGESTVWATQAFDALGRITSMTTPDNAAITTMYSGNAVTVTDQAGKVRKSVTDALGRLIEAFEDPASLNYQTSYTYDVLDNLVKIVQGTQQRFFMHDSLKRLIRTRNPEQNTLASLNLSDSISGNSAWSTGYQYDAAGNLTQKTDARGVISTYVYDALNRNTTIDYSDTASITPDVKWFYDGATNGKGRFWYFYKGGDFSTGSNVDHKAIDSYDALGRPLVHRQLFKLNGTWSPTYQTSRGYNLAGEVTSQTYPSGHTVSYSYDAAGRTAGFTGNLGDGVSRTYASTFVYNARNQVTQELFGTQTPLYHKLQYNIRGQLWDVRVSTGADINGSWNRGCLQFFYESTLTHGASGPDNNGNVLKASHYIPLDDTSSTWAIPHQIFTYDALNRISSVSEYFLSSSQSLTQTALQSYTYDRWGNRTINAASWGTGINVKQFSVDAATNRLGVPAGQMGTMVYDNAGNLTNDTYTGAGVRTYDAENRMLTATDNSSQTSRYTYDAEGNRVRRQVSSSQEEWQIYGMENELLAEYRATSVATAPEREYGYRDGQLLITATGRFNVALAANGAVATASTTATGSGFSTTAAINGNYRGPWGNGEGWNDNTPNSMPDWIQVDFAGSKTIDEISVFGLHDNYTVENAPTETQTFTLYGLIAFNVQYWNGSSWITIPGGNVTANNNVWRKFTFSPVTTSKIRVTINAVPDSWSRVVEIQAFGTSAGGERVQWLVADHLGTPRIVLDQTGSLANVKRHDYLPFGEELFAGTGGRTAAQGYAGDGVRQQFTEKERDIETGLDYFLARYYSSTQGRFTSIDPYNPILHSEDATEFMTYLSQPQNWNRYAYVLNNPLKYVDPFGEDVVLTGTEEDQKEGLERLRRMLGEERFNLLDVNQQNIKGLGNVTVVNFGSEENQRKFTAIGGDNAYEVEFSQGMADIIGSSEHVEFRLAESFEYKSCILCVCETGRDSTTNVKWGGAVTVNKNESLTGNVQIFVSREAANVAAFALYNYRKTHSSNGDALTFTDEQVDAHEFGHAHNVIKFGMRAEGSYRALRFENILRHRQGSSNTRIKH